MSGRRLTLAFAALVLSTVLTSGDAAVVKDTNGQDNNRELVARAFDAWRDGTGSPYDLLADDAQWTITGNSQAAKTYSSREAFLSEVIRPFNARMRTRLVPAVRKLYVDGT